MADLAEETGESVQLFVREGDTRVCVEAVESGRGLRDIVPVGARLPVVTGHHPVVLEGRR
jgi:DNA-binding IclR family transcriptional regulator